MMQRWPRNLFGILLTVTMCLIFAACTQSTPTDRTGPRAKRDAAVTPPSDAGLSDTPVRVDGGMGMVDAGNDQDSGQPDTGLPPPTWGLDQRPSNPTCVAPARPATSNVQVQLTRVFTNIGGFNRPILARQAPGDGSRWYVVEQSGRILAFDNTPSVSQTDTFIDIRSQVDDGPNEAGLLGMAFHPDFANNAQVFLSYTANESSGLTSRISRFVSSDNGFSLDPGSEEVLLRVDQPFGNHNGGHIAFGPDGFLYIGLGDGGAGGDPYGHGQDTATLLGAMLRIDVDGGSPYAIPPDNPFASGQGGRPEIYAWGLRNPWRFSFDRDTGELWVGDVGQGDLEEVDLVELGGNYGWKIKEGTQRYSSGSFAGLIDPVTEYGRSQGYSITGGYVYHGQAIPQLSGVYLYGDYGSDRAWGLFFDPATGDASPSLLLTNANSVSSFAQGEDGEVYVVSLNGYISRIDPSSSPPADNFPQKLSETGCFDTTNPTLPNPGLIPYDVNAPLWSDGAEKERWMAIPDGQKITIGSDGDWALPNGTVLIKTFWIGQRRVETRLFMRHPDGVWAGYTYAWAADQSDATLLRAGTRVDVSGQSWQIPSRAQCMSCHTNAAGRSLGLETAQLNGSFMYPNGRTANQLKTLDHIGLFTSPLGAEPSQLDALAKYTTSQPVADRARAYLHSNCSGCHRVGGPGLGNMDMRYSLDVASMNLCNVNPEQGTFGISGAKLVYPGQPSRSVVSHRIHALDAARMPPLASEMVDPRGTQIVDDWITGLSACP